jgi:anti-sigma factor RsiW
MNSDAKLKFIAFLDGQLPGNEASAMERLLANDPEARAMADQWRALKRLLAAGESAAPLPAAREQYWGEIARRLDGLEAEERRRAPARQGRRLPWWVRLFAPVTAGAAVVLALVFGLASRPNVSLTYAEVESPLDDAGAIIFHSETEQMTVVWVDTH